MPLTFGFEDFQLVKVWSAGPLRYDLLLLMDTTRKHELFLICRHWGSDEEGHNVIS